MPTRSRLPSLLFGSTLLLALAGCDMAQESADRLAEKTREAAEELAREAINDTVDQVNKEVDKAQQATREWLKAKPGEQPEQPPRAEGERPKEGDAMMPPAGVET
ncbi:hypothetical protein V0R51_11245 [Pseudomonas otitidis]|jgi:hypothetical protein|uniref:hypothetical protein n=1 Tax=Metapseudomonas otitidis TaxID=319939 RepID=UPI002E7B1403|nr:hypothetical protein [Pseudomonas otitidis]MEE1893479.1 hypothetical protein [Pseudomonas otitidis]